MCERFAILFLHQHGAESRQKRGRAVVLSGNARLKVTEPHTVSAIKAGELSVALASGRIRRSEFRAPLMVAGRAGYLLCALSRPAQGMLVPAPRFFSSPQDVAGNVWLLTSSATGSGTAWTRG